MDSVTILLGLGIVGAALGSFAAATVWRLRARQLQVDKANHEPYDKKEYTALKKLLGVKRLEDRSRCLHCGATLRWYELLPVLSWVAQRGRCRSCHAFIGWFELLAEVSLAAFFVVSFVFWPYPLDSVIHIVQLGIWLLAGVVMTILFAYDAKWYLLPDRATILLAGLGLVSAILAVIDAQVPFTAGMSVVGALALLPGVYLALYLFSKGQWVGFGDVKLGVGLALLLADWKLAFLALFMANFIGTLIVFPLLLAGKIKRTTKIPFGPLLIVGTVVAALFGPTIINQYAYLLLPL